MYICGKQTYMQILRIYQTSINDRFITQAADTLRAGGVIIYPTDTLYAIGCSALSVPAIEKVCRLKGINPQKNTLSIICSNISQASEYARIDNTAFNILRSHVPGPYTFILPAATTLPKVFKGRREVGVRIPDNAIARSLAEELGAPLLTTSLPSDGLTTEEITLPEEISLRAENIPTVDMIIDGGTGGYIPSTIVDLTDSKSPVIVREGAGEIDF